MTTPPTPAPTTAPRTAEDLTRALLLADRFMQLPISRWKEALDKLNEKDGSLLENELAARAVEIARAAAYTAGRFPGPSKDDMQHKAAVKRVNRTVLILRSALGYVSTPEHMMLSSAVQPPTTTPPPQRSGYTGAMGYSGPDDEHSIMSESYEDT